MKSSLAIAVLLSFSWLSAAAGAQVMNFESFADDAECPAGAAGVVQNGLSLMDDTPYPAMDSESCVFGPNNMFPPPGPIVTNGTVVYGWCGNCSASVLTITLQREDGAPFQLRSIDFSRIPGSSGSAVINITGYPSGGGAPVTVQHTIDSDAWVTVNIAGLDSVERVEINKSPLATIDTLLDNIVTGPAVSASGATPVPLMGPVTQGLLVLLVLFAGVSRARRPG